MTNQRRGNLALCVALVSLSSVACGQQQPQPTRDEAEPSQELQPENELASAFDVSEKDVLEARKMKVDGRIVAVMGRFTRNEQTYGGVAKIGGGAKSFGHLKSFDFVQLADLSASATLRISTRLPERSTAKGMKQPVFVFHAFDKEEVAVSPKSGLGDGVTGTRVVRRLILVRYHPTLEVLLDTEMERRSEDGFGGHLIRSLELEHEDGKTLLLGERQDFLPAQRARCLKPEPRPVSFELEGARFRDVSAPHVGGCGG